ncbi:MAG: LytR C-terminal domain-containing protein [Patescibacteria group bacterium]
MIDILLMFFSKKPTILFLQNNRLSLYSKTYPEGALFEFSEKATKNLTISGTEKLLEHLETFMAERNIIPGQYILVIGEEIFHQKKIMSTEKEEQQKEIAQLLKDSNITSEHQLKETFELEGSIYTIVTNKDFLEKIVTILQKLEWETVSVVPVSVFRDIANSKIKKDGLSKKEVQEISNNTKLVKAANILPPIVISKPETTEKEVLAKETTDEEESNEVPMSKINKKIILVVLIICLFGVGALLVAQNSSSIPFLTKPEPTLIPSPTTAPTPTEVPSLDKKEIKIRIQNGTGIVGQASKIKTIFEDLDYSDIRTGNSDVEDNIETTVIFSQKIPTKYKEEILEALKKVFTTVTDTTGKNDQFDVDVLTGKGE